MKRYLAVERLIDEDGSKGWFQLIFSARDEESALEWVTDYASLFGTKVKFCGETV